MYASMVSMERLAVDNRPKPATVPRDPFPHSVTIVLGADIPFEHTSRVSKERLVVETKPVPRLPPSFPLCS